MLRILQREDQVQRVRRIGEQLEILAQMTSCLQVRDEVVDGQTVGRFDVRLCECLR